MYDRNVKGKNLTFCVSGQLWNRSLIMKDLETSSRWSHILGVSVHGKLKDTELTTIPCDMVTWSAWMREHPKTTVLNMSRTHRDFTKEFYKTPERFVVGLSGFDGMLHCSFATLKASPLLNVQQKDEPLLITFDPESTSARIFSRTLGKRTLTFAPVESKRNLLRDDQTSSTWNRATGVAVGGTLAGKRLAPVVGIVSFTRAWKTLHPDSKEIVADDGAVGRIGR